jgi:two-component system, NtrC family, sensor kinase
MGRGCQSVHCAVPGSDSSRCGGLNLLNELGESLQQQTATADVLKVISSSPTDLQPVFESIVQDAARLCEASNASLHRVEGDVMRHVASHGEIMTVGAK